MLSSGSTEAGELNLTANTSVGYNSNIESRPSDDPRGDVEAALIRLNLRGEVQDEFERVEYALAYAPSYFLSTARDVDNFWNHRAFLSGSYKLSPRTRMTLRNAFLFIDRLVLGPAEFEELAPGGPPPPGNDPDLQELDSQTLRNVFEFGGTHLFRPRWSGYAGTNYTIYRYSRENEADSDAVSARIGTDYQLTRGLRVGVGGGVSYRSFEGRAATGLVTVLPPAVPTPTPDVPRCFGQTSPRSRSLSYSAFFSTAYEFDETTRVHLRIGPARIQSESYSCPLNLATPNFPQGVTFGSALSFASFQNNQTTWFGEGELSKRWRHFSTRLSFRRDQGLGVGGNSAITDMVVAGADWSLGRLWSLGASANWLRREPFVGDDSTGWTGVVALSRRFLRRLVGGLSVSYRKETGSRSFDAWNVSLSMKYSLEPIGF